MLTCLGAGYQMMHQKRKKFEIHPREHVIFMLKICINFTLHDGVCVFECAGLDICGAAINYQRGCCMISE